jgi:serine/threonine protein phosphatase PrpC
MPLIGYSHLSEKNGVGQDSSDVRTPQNGWVIGVIADGLGSAKHSEIGSSLAVSEVIEFVEKNTIFTARERRA